MGQATPLRIAEALRGFRRAPGLEQAAALLVVAPPQIGEVQGHGRWRCDQQGGEGEQPAAAAGAGGQQEQRQQQPVTLVGPAGQRLHGRRGLAAGATAGQQAEVGQIAIVQAQGAVAAA
ncbi:hypothetical protein D3C72_2031810 [compost metagenome]